MLTACGTTNAHCSSYSDHQNGVAGYRIRTLSENACSMIINSQLQLVSQGEVVNIAVFLH